MEHLLVLWKLSLNTSLVIFVKKKKYNSPFKYNFNNNNNNDHNNNNKKAVAVRDWCEEKLPNFGDKDNPRLKLIRSAIKSCCAGIAGAALTNPLDVIRNE